MCARTPRTLRTQTLCAGSSFACSSWTSLRRTILSRCRCAHKQKQWSRQRSRLTTCIIGLAAQRLRSIATGLIEIDAKTSADNVEIFRGKSNCFSFACVRPNYYAKIKNPMRKCYRNWGPTIDASRSRKLVKLNEIWRPPEMLRDFPGRSKTSETATELLANR